jgi:hypothetical protein
MDALKVKEFSASSWKPKVYHHIRIDPPLILSPNPGESCPHPTQFSRLSQMRGQHYNPEMKSAHAVKYLSSIREISVSNLTSVTNCSDASRAYPQFIQPNDGRVP